MLAEKASVSTQPLCHPKRSEGTVPQARDANALAGRGTNPSPSNEKANDQRPKANDRSYCTTSVIGVVCENDPEVAVTFTV